MPPVFVDPAQQAEGDLLLMDAALAMVRAQHLCIQL